MSGPSTLVVDLDAINHNLRCAAQLASGRDVLAAVKADAYGHGLVPVARSIQQAGTAQWLGVATVAEAQQLREAGITLPVLKFTPPSFDDELPAAIAAGLVHTVGSHAQADALAAAATAAGAQALVHLKVDTGMRRVGVHPSEALDLAHHIRSLTSLRLDGMFTHLPVSDVPDGAEFTAGQLATMEELVSQVGGDLRVHVANSGAVLSGMLGPSTTMVRPGIMVYGSYPDPQTPRSATLRPVVRWTARISHIKSVAEGESVGYGRTWVAPRDTHIATVAVGYGDGYPRALSNTGRMLAGGVSCPVAGRVCMDQTMIDLGPETPRVRPGDDAVLVGRSGEEEITVADLAELTGTIPYEITCQITARVPREYC